MSVLGIVHTACGVLALLLGTAIFLRPKGTKAHVRVGWAYAVCMGAVNVTALCTYRLTGHFNLFHALALTNLAMVAGGIAQVVPRCRPRHWAWRHYHYTCWSYVGLLAATNNEAFVRIPVLARLTGNTAAALPMLATAGLVAACGAVIVRKQDAVLGRYGLAGRTREHADAP